MNVADIPLISLITFVPLVGAIVIAFLPRQQAGLIRATALVFALVAFGLSLLLLIGFNPTNPAFQYQEVHDWVPLFGIQYKVGADGLSTILVVLTTTLSWISILASFGPIKERLKEYMISFLILEVGLIGVFVALDLFLFYIFWEVVLVPMYLIIGIWGGSNRIYATIKFVLYTLVGSLLMLVGDPGHGLHLRSGDRDLGRRLRLHHPAQLRGDHRLRQQRPAVRLPGLLPGLRHQGPDVPVPYLAARRPRRGAHGRLGHPGRRSCSSWAPTASSASRVPLFPGAALTFSPLIIVLSLIAIIYGAIVALVQPDLEEADRLLLGDPHGLRHPGHLHLPGTGPPGGHPPDGQPRPDHRRPCS